MQCAITQSLHEIGRAYGKLLSCICCLLLPPGGIAPAARRRSRLDLTLAEQVDISPKHQYLRELHPVKVPPLGESHWPV